MVKAQADLHNHFTTRSRVLPFHPVVETVRGRLGLGAVCGLVNCKDRRYEAFTEKVPSSVINVGNAIYDPIRDVWIVKGEELKTPQGDLLLLATYQGVHLQPRKTLKDNLSQARDYGAIVIGTEIFSGRSEIGALLEEDPELLNSFDAIQVFDGEMILGNSNARAQLFYERMKGDFPHLGQLASSDGHSFREVGTSYTTLTMPDYDELRTPDDFRESLRQAVRQSRDPQRLHKQLSRIGSLKHASVIGAMILASKLGVKLSEGDSEALRLSE